MRIAVTTSGLPPGLGIATAVNEVAAYLHSQAVEIIVFYSSNDEIKLNNTPYKMIEFKIPSDKRYELSVNRKLFENLMEYDPDLIIINDDIYTSNIIPCLSERPVVISVTHNYRQHFRFDSAKLVTTAALHNWQYLDWIVSISDAMKSGIVNDYNIDNRMIHTIYNGMDIDQITEDKLKAKHREQKPILFFAGGLNHTKGYRTFWKAFRELNRRKLSFTAKWSGSDLISNEFKQHLPQFSNISWLGRLPHEELLNQLEQAHFLIMPSYAEGCPMLLLEGMAKGVVPLVSDCPSAMREIVAEAKCGEIFPVGHHKVLTDQLESLLNNREQMEEYAIKAVQYFQEHLNIKKTCEELLRLGSAPRQTRNKRGLSFPPPNMHYWHRRPYIYHKFDPRGLPRRIRQSLGILPPKMIIDSNCKKGGN